MLIRTGECVGVPGCTWVAAAVAAKVDVRDEPDVSLVPSLCFRQPSRLASTTPASILADTRGAQAHTLDMAHDSQPLLGTTNWGHAASARVCHREILVPRDVIEALGAHIAAYGLGEDGLIFHAEDGGFVRRSAFSAKVWVPARKGCQPARRCRHPRLEALLRLPADPLQRVGQDPVQNRLGHASAQETLDTYGHMWPDADSGPARRWPVCSPNLLRQTSGKRAQTFSKNLIRAGISGKSVSKPD